MQNSYRNVLLPESRPVGSGVIFDGGHTVAATLAFDEDLVDVGASAVSLVDVDGPVAGVAAIGGGVDGDVDVKVARRGGLTGLWSADAT